MANFGIVAIVVAAIGICRVLLRRKPVALAFHDEREERLTRRLAGEVHGSLADVLPSVREELRLGPSQSDETILKRAAYHYRQNLPEKTCSVYRDAAKG